MSNVWVQQQAVLSRAELQAELEMILMEGVPQGKGGGPDMSMLRKASSATDRIMALIDRYSPPRR